MRWLCFAAVILLFATIAKAQSAPDASAWTVNGSAVIQKMPDRGGYRLRLTTNGSSQQGSAFLTTPITFHEGNTFSYYFQFQMTNPNYQPSDGMTFVLQTEGPTALGAGGGCLGYSGTPGISCGTPSSGGIMPSVAVEFDDYQNVPWDINSNHVAILTNGQTNDTDSQTPYGVANCQPTGPFGCMNNGDVWSVWIDYDGARLHVALADYSTVRPADLIDYAIDIPAILGASSAYVGFTAGTGAGSEYHYVMNFEPGNPR